MPAAKPGGIKLSRVIRCECLLFVLRKCSNQNKFHNDEYIFSIDSHIIKRCRLRLWPTVEAKSVQQRALISFIQLLQPSAGQVFTDPPSLCWQVYTNPNKC